MAKPVKSNDANNFKNIKIVKKGKEEEGNINIKKIKEINNRVKILASDYFSASVASTKSKKPNMVTEKVRMNSYCCSQSEKITNMPFH